jgi:hypothetical protein
VIEALTAPDKEQKTAYKRSTAASPLRVDAPAQWGRVKPEDYHSDFPPLVAMSPNSGTKNAFGNGAATHSVPLITRKSVTILPRMYSFHPKVLQTQRELSHELDKALPFDLDDDKFTRTGIHADFSKLRTVGGYFMNPMSFTTVDNAEYRKELGLSAGYSARQKAIAHEVWRMVWSTAKVSKVKVAKLSTGGGRRFTFDVQWKLAFTEWLLEPDNFEDMLNAVWKDDWLTLANRFETIYFTYIQKRGQVDSADKKRTVFDLEYALSGGLKGRAYDADKRVVIDGAEYPDFSAMRARVVHAGPWAINCFLQMCGTPVMRALFARFPKTFHVNTRDEILSVINGKHIVCSDVKEYDRSMSRDAISSVHDTMVEYFDERIVKASAKLFNAPYYAKPLDLDGKKGVWVGDITDPTSEVFAGNRSGHALTSLVAKVNKVIETLFVIDLIYPVLGRTESFLKGNMPIGMVNNGDDEMIWAESKADLDRYLELRKDPLNGHYLVAPEDGQGFSGLLMKKLGDTEYDPVPRIHTTYEKMLSPERSIGGKHRAYWAIGAMARIDNIMLSEAGRESWQIFLSVYRRNLEQEFGALLDLIKEGMQAVPLDMHGMSTIDKAVIEDPDKLHYMYDDEDVSSEVVAAVTSNIPIEVTEKFLRKYYRGNTI